MRNSWLKRITTGNVVFYCLYMFVFFFQLKTKTFLYSSTYSTFSSTLASRIEKVGGVSGGGGLGSAVSMALCHIRKYVFSSVCVCFFFFFLNLLISQHICVCTQVNPSESRSSIQSFGDSFFRGFFLSVCIFDEQYFLCSKIQCDH